MQCKLISGLICVLLSALSACSDNNGTAPFAGGLRAANGITDSSGLDVELTGISVPTDLQNIAFNSGSHIAQIPEGNYRANLSSGNSGGGAADFTVDNIAIDHNHVDTIFAYGRVADNTANGFTADQALNPPDKGNFMIQFVNAAYAESLTPQGQTLTFSLVVPGSSSAGSAPYSVEVPFGSSTASVAISAGTYEIIVKDAGGGLVFDSGQQGIQLPAGGANVFQAALLDTPPNSGTIPPVHCPLASLLLLDNTGGNKPYTSAQVCPL